MDMGYVEEQNNRFNAAYKGLRENIEKLEDIPKEQKDEMYALLDLMKETVVDIEAFFGNYLREIAENNENVRGPLEQMLSGNPKNQNP